MAEKVIAFNTKRFYTHAGQRIAAMAHNNGILFVDIDRGIDGFISGMNPTLDRYTVMAAYDHQLYQGRDYEPETLSKLKALRMAAELMHLDLA